MNRISLISSRLNRNITSVVLNSDVLPVGEQKNKNFKERMNEYLKNRQNSVLNTKTFKHPMDSKHHPINFSPFRHSELVMDFIGPEQVSANYEPLSVARQFALTGIFSLGAISYFMKISDLNWVLESSFIGLFYYFLQYFVFFEGVKYLFL